MNAQAHFSFIKQETPLAKIRRIADTLEAYQNLINEALAYDGGTHSFDDVAADIFAGRLELHTFDDCIIIGTVVNNPRRRTYEVHVACGDLASVKAQDGFLRRHARALGCDQLTLIGRRGWTRALAELGWRETMVIMERDL